MTTTVIEQALDAMRGAGAIIVDPADIPNADKLDPSFEVLLYEFKAGITSYLRDRGRSSSTRPLPTSSRSTNGNASARCPTSGRNCSKKPRRRGH